jgi:hypothetical protein
MFFFSFGGQGKWPEQQTCLVTFQQVIYFVYLILKNPVPYSRYKILCANLMKEPQDPQKTTQFILDYVNLDAQQYRMGHTKVHT